MLYKIILLSILFTFFKFQNLSSQANDYVWPIGAHGFSTVDMILSDSIEKTFWPFTLDFNHEPMQVRYYPHRRFMFHASNSAYSTDNGQLHCYTNGMQLYGGDDLPLAGGDTINYGSYWRSRVRSQTGDKIGFTQFQGIIILPIEKGEDKLLYIFNIILDVNVGGPIGVWYSIVDRDCDNNRGCVVSKDNVLMEHKIKSNMLKACRHGNGRDWWLNVVSEDNTIIYTYLLDDSGVQEVHQQSIGKFNPELSAGTATFSHDGTKYAINDGRYWDSAGVISIFDFDRCTGLLSNPFFDTLVIPEGSVGQGIAFSPNDRYLYVNNRNDLYQYDMQDLSKPRVHIDTYDGFYDGDIPGFRETPFGFWGYGPDGRLYNVSGAASAKHMHIMDYPNEEGEACTFKQHVLRIPNNPWSIPNFPHYRLGPLDGSPCDTLGMDNHPVAKFRYEADSLDHRDIRFTDLSYFRPETWTWDFGDGSASITTQHPYHTYERNGIYNVCLTVSNENSSNTLCRTLNIGIPVSTEETARPEIQLSLFPNPTSDFATLTLGEYIPQKGQVVVYDIAGRQVLSQRLYHGHNTLNLSSCAPGLYIWKALDGTAEVGSGKLVKE